MKRVVLAGATGLVGGHLLDQLLAGPELDDVLVLGRRPPVRQHPRLHSRVVDFRELDRLPPVPNDVALCALGTTLKAAGSQAAFRAVDHDAVVAFARWARRGGASTFVTISSVGATPASRNFYLRVKGETERSLAALGYPRLVNLRPSWLLGTRPDRRPGEAVAQTAARGLGFLLQGNLRRYRAVRADEVAAAALAAARDPRPGHLVWHYDEIRAAAGALR